MQFKIQHPICGVNLFNNISITQVKVNMRETEHDTTFETQAINFKDKFVHNSIQW